jgi:septal ring factor EnvC (AmiA/AmiB activator)
MVSDLERARTYLKAANKELMGQVESLQASIERNKALVEEAEACARRNVDLHVELKEKDGDLKKAKEARQTAVVLVEARAKDLKDSRVALLACMKEAKASIDSAFAKGGARLSEALPEADSVAFLEWLQAEVGQFEKLLDGVSDLGAYGAALAIA